MNLDKLSLLPKGTLGREFADHMKALKLDPEALPNRDDKTDYDYIMAHLFETHDIWHVVTGFNTDVAGELGLQAFYVGQGPFMLGILLISLGMLNTLIFARHDYSRRLEEIARGYMMGRRARPFFGVVWDDLWEKPLTQVRGNLIPAEVIA